MKKQGEKTMTKKYLMIVSCFCITVLALAGCTPALASQPIPTTKTTVPIEVTRYAGKNPESTITSVSPADAWQIQQCLIELYNAQQRNDRATITRCVAMLNSKGITIRAQDQAYLTPERVLRFYGQAIGRTGLMDDVTNQACLFTAIGEGMLFGAFALKIIQAVSEVIKNQTTFLGALIMLIIMLPFLLFAVLINAIIPIRILMPVGTLVLSNGTVRTIGTQGAKTLKVNATQIEVNVSWFTGLTINIPKLSNESKPFCFVAGFAGKVEGPLSS
jgi:hypothetical protein